MSTTKKGQDIAQGAAPAVNNENTTAVQATPAHEIGKNLPAVQKKVIDLATTIQSVEVLHKKIQQRDRLEYYAEELQSFSVEEKEEDLGGNTNRFYGCELSIKDDNGNGFQLRHPVVIKEVIDFMFGRFSARKAEIEAEIKFPNAA